MNNIKFIRNTLILVFISSFILFSCRKKDERYEGVYTGTERHTIRDSGEVTFRLDTTYVQGIEVTYSKNIYYFSLGSYNAENDVFSVDRKSIEDHVYKGEGGDLEFLGDSMILKRTNFSDYIDYPDQQVWLFKGSKH